MPQSALALDPPTTIDNPLLFTGDSFAPRADQNAGAHIERIAFNIPPGRNGLTPELALAYNSQDLADGIVGYGWTLSIPYIERMNRTGSERLYVDNYFTSSFGGELATTSTANQYRHRFEDGRFITYTFSNNTWTAYDKSGTRYLFGASTTTQQFATTSPSNVYRWMLEEVRDTNGNFMRYVYTKDGNQIYPSQIVYTGNGSTNGVFTIDITKSARPDRNVSYKPGFKVTTDYRITEVKASVNGTWVRKYAISYASGVNGARSLLSSVQETGRDDQGTELTLPALTLGYSSSTPSYEDHTNPRILSGSRVAADVDGNGLPDRSIFYSNSTPSNTHRLIEENEYPTFNSSDNQTTSEFWTYSNVGGTGANQYPPLERGTRFFDFNGDGRADILRTFKDGSTYTREYYESTSAFTWTQKTATGTMPTFGCKSGADTYSTGLFGNLNGDGLTDYVAAIPYCSVSGSYLGTGTTSGWTASSTVFGAVANMPTSVSDTSSSDLVDINGDGLDDWVYSSGGTTRFYFNTGTGWSTYDPAWTIATSTRHANGWDRGIRFFDINSDGLPDYIRSYYMPTYGGGSAAAIEKGTFEYVYLNTGFGFATSTLDVPGTIFSGVTTEAGNWNGNIDYDEPVDWNGDGIPDFSSKTSTSTALAKPDVLTAVTYPTGGSVELQYKYTAQLGTNAELAFPVLVVTKATRRDNLGNAEVTTYTYEGGKMYLSGDALDRRFAGFKTITKSDALGRTKTYFNQGDTIDTSTGEQTDGFALIGKAYREDVMPLSTTTPLRTTYTKWNVLDQGSGKRWFVYREKELVQHYDGDSDHRDVATEYVYATTTGNLTETIERGEVTGASDGTYVDTGSDSRFTVFSYGTTTPINLSLPTSRAVKNHGSTTLFHARFHYDSQPFGSTTKGNLTKEENWISGNTFASTTKQYTSYGLVGTTTDPRSKTTSYTFDPYNLYVATSTNPLSQKTGFVYNYATGKVRQTTDPNSRTSKFVFDPVGRLKEKMAPDPSSGLPVTQSLFTYTDSEFPRKVQESRYLNSGTSTDIFTYSDGFGRVVQERTESDGTYTVKDKIYGSSGLLEKESLPYFSAGSAWTSAQTSGPLLVTYARDALKRVTSIANALGTEGHAFDQWTETITDREGNPKDLASDAYGNLASVVEYYEAGATTTTYAYDALNNLAKITDAGGNVRTFGYDGLSRATSSQDLHAPIDTTFGSTTFAYDLAGNLTSRTDPKGQVVNWTYDDINRVLTEDYTGASGTETTYTYDSCTNGVGYLCTASSSISKTTNSYDPLGRVSTATTTVSGASYVTTQTYDRQGNPAGITYPNGSLVRYSYDAAGMLDSVSRKLSGGAWSSLVTNLDYGPTGAVTLKKFGSGATTTLTYDENALYRLKRVATYGAFVSATTTTTSSSTIPTPTHYWKLDESSGTAADTIGGMTLTNNNSTAYAAGKINNGGDFERDNSNYLNTTTNIAGSTLTAFTFSLWYKPESQPATNTNHLLFYSSDAPGDLMLYYLDSGGTKKLRFYVSDDTGATQNLFYNVTLSTGTWHHIVGRWDGSELRLFVDGVDSGQTQSVSSMWTSETAGTFIGGHTSASLDSDGMVDEVGFWPSSLSTTTIAELYNGGAGQTYPFGSSTVATSTLYTMLQDINYTYDNVGNITQIFDTSSTTAEKTAIFAYDALYRLVSASTTFATSSPYKRGFAYDPLGNIVEEGTTTQASYAASVADPTHYWKLDESSGTAADAVGGITLTNNNSTAYAAGKISNGADFERSNSNYLNSTTDLHGSTLTAATVSLWFKPESQPATNTNYLLFYTGEPYGEVMLYYIDSGGTKKLRFYIESTESLYYDVTLSAGTWYHIVARWNGSQLHLFVDGTEVASRSAATISTSEAAGTFIGGHTSASLDSDGMVDEVGFWPSALTSDEIEELYNGGLGRTYPFASGSSGDNRVYTYASTGYANPHAVTSIGNGTATTTYAYDNNGNLTAAGTRTFSWNYNNWLTQVLGTGTSTYGYDHAGQRVWQISSSATSSYPNKFFSVATSTNGKGTTTEYIYAGNDLVATVEGASTSTAATRYVHPDHLGSTNVVSDQSMNAVQTLDYFPYGSTRIDTGTDVSQREFIGQFFDEQNSLSYLNARYYEPARGQFLSQDPTHLAVGNPQQIKQLTDVDQRIYLTDPQSLNSYSYARNNPIVNKDPQGNFAFAVPLYYAAVTAPQWGPAIAGGIVAAGTYIASDIMLRNGDRMREIPFDARRLPPSSMLGPENPMDSRSPNFNNPKIPGWIKAAVLGGMAAEFVKEMWEPYQEQGEFLKRIRDPQQTRDGSQGAGSNSTRAPTTNTASQYNYAGSSRSGGGGVSLSSLRVQLESALSKLKALSNRRSNN